MKKKSTSRSAFFKLRVVLSLLLVSGGIALALAAFTKATAQNSKDKVPQKPVTEAQYRGVLQVTHFDVSPPLRDIAPVYPGPKPDREKEDQDIVPRDAGFQHEPDTVVQSRVGEEPNIPGPLVSFDAQSNISGVAPPDPNGDVGPNHIVAMSNLHTQIFNKTGTSLLGPIASNTIWAGFGGGCQTRNDGDPVVLHDQISDRWLLMQFTSAAPYLLCVAVSQTPDPTGAYYRYSIATGGGNNFADYPKMGVWPDGYYFSTREFAGGSTFVGVGAYVMNRAQAVAGNPAPQVISFLAAPSPAYNVGDGLLPSDLDGSTLPPAGRSNYFVGSMDNNGPYGAPQDALTVWKFTVDFVTPANSSFVLTNTVPVASFNSILGLCGGGRTCIPQPGTANRIDHLGYRQRPLHRLAYRNFGTHESLVTNQSVSAGTGPNGEVSGIRWWELRSPSSSPFIHQQGTYAPGLTDGIHRWMGSIAMDGAGNMGLAYSAANSASPALFPSIWYTGRNAGSALGTMPLGENSIITGTGSQTAGGNRWGDYSSITVDPVDDSTFWVVNEYLPTTSASGWRLRVGAFKVIPAPAPALGTGTITAESCTPVNMMPDPGETVTMSLCVTNNGDLPTTNVVGTLQATGGVSMPSGPQNYGVIPPLGTVCRTFTFVATGVCGGTITPSLQIQDGAINYGTPSYPGMVMGTSSNSVIANFDTVVAPALPAGWTTSATGIGVPWVTSTTTPFSAPNAAFAPDPSNIGDSQLVSPVIAVPAGGATLTFKNNYNTEATFDGMVLEISINGGAYADIIAAGGSFVTGGYNATISTGFSSPIAGRMAWAGNSGGYITSTVTMPPAANGQMMQLKWRMATDSSVTATGVRIDDIAFSNPPVCATSCSAAPVPLSAVSRKTHGGQGDFDINLPLSGTSGVECRRGQGAGQNDHTIVVTFGGAASVSGSPQAQVTSGSGTIGSNGVPNGGAVTVSGNTVTIPLTSVTNAQVVTVTLNGVTVGANSGNVVIPMGVLLGDTNENRTTNSGDTLQTRGRSGQLTDGTNFRSDVNPDGTIAAGDVIIVRGQSGNSLP